MIRGVAQLGSAPAWGAGGRWFKSSLPDRLYNIVNFVNLERKKYG